MDEMRYPDVMVRMIGEDGNVFSIIGRVKKAIRRVHGSEAAQEFAYEALAQGSYDEVLALVMRTVEVE